MKKNLLVCISFFMFCGVASNAYACLQSSVLYSDEYNADLWMAPSWQKGASSCSFSLSLPDVAAGSGLSVTDAFLVLSFMNDGGFMDLTQSAIVSDRYVWSYFGVDTGNIIIPVSKDGIIALNTDGTLAFTLSRLVGDFTFNSAQLLAFSESSPVPLPPSVWLLAPMLCLMLAARRRVRVPSAS